MKFPNGLRPYKTGTDKLCSHETRLPLLAKTIDDDDDGLTKTRFPLVDPESRGFLLGFALRVITWDAIAAVAVLHSAAVAAAVVAAPRLCAAARSCCAVGGRCSCGYADCWGWSKPSCRCCRSAPCSGACVRSVCAASTALGRSGFCCRARIETHRSRHCRPTDLAAEPDTHVGYSLFSLFITSSCFSLFVFFLLAMIIFYDCDLFLSASKRGRRRVEVIRSCSRLFCIYHQAFLAHVCFFIYYYFF